MVDSFDRWFIFGEMMRPSAVIIAILWTLTPRGARALDSLAQPDSVEVFIHAGGVHSDIIVPITTSYWNWRNTIEAPPHQTDLHDWLTFGWGSKVFYLNTPQWSQVKIKHMVYAMLGIGGAAYHVSSSPKPIVSDHCKAIRLHQSEYLALCGFLAEQFATEARPAPMIAFKPAHSWDAFYSAKGHYWLFNNCNTWSNRALKMCNRSRRYWALTYGHVLNQ